MQSWWASRVHPHGSTHDPGGSEGSSSVKHMKHRRGASVGFCGTIAAASGASWVSDDMVEDCNLRSRAKRANRWGSRGDVSMERIYIIACQYDNDGSKQSSKQKTNEALSQTWMLMMMLGCDTERGGSS
jgi:hypothetical protein